ncbi:MAG: putative ABC transporter ATP-binding protein YjjK [Bacteroidetes bacterium ADurb.Bin408]|nr:MAG: putative ABC transporter ATP-binding protein YjjK [Bacteroidetes bacterium ADurb.Bin408]
MILLQAENISKSYNEKALFTGLSFGIHKGQKIALIAKNGTGKTTLLKILAGCEEADSGTIVMRNDLSYAYLAQNPIFNDKLSVLESVFAGAGNEAAIIKAYEQALMSGDKDNIANTYDQMNRLNLWDYEAQVKQILGQLEITDFDQLTGAMSGGQKKRLALASVLISRPELLILDEPTNHLDLDMIIWLEKYLDRLNCTLLMVTHDRYFLDRVCNDIIEMDDGHLYRYSGNYAYFLEKRNERIDNENMVVSKARNLYRRELEWMRQTPQARTTKSKSRIESFYEVQEIASSKRIEKKINLDMKTTRLGKKIMEIYYIGKSYAGKKLLENFTYTFKRNERIGIVGKNGCGKTTLLEILTGRIPADAGFIDTGDTVKIGYYRQEGIQFKEEQRVIDIAREIADVIVMSNGNKVSVPEFLRQFLFTNEMQYTPVARLSGGERRRLYLMTVLMKNPNFLILDEPTNDLDILTLNVLEEYLCNFNGCVLMVSHDRYFMDKIVEHLFVFEGETVVKDFPGNYSDYLLYKERKDALARKLQPKPEKIIKEKNTSDKPVKLTYKEQKEYETLETEIALLETEKKQLEEQLSANATDHEKVLALSTRLGEILSLLDQKSDRWLELGMKGEGTFGV